MLHAQVGVITKAKQLQQLGDSSRSMTGETGSDSIPERNNRGPIAETPSHVGERQHRDDEWRKAGWLILILLVM